MNYTCGDGTLNDKYGWNPKIEKELKYEYDPFRR
jgi:hypothetical protein